ncbi:MAB_1171c family putative transporter [Streptomyces sp. AC602_WCS936]|uniref:MAB_1171c family putative transporter n=1 Tax=Streptomyces sp. AC602_WCS936 TaxID=2823685 RepID=UPI001C26762E|nr:MAB_1171c family putative transporter [Streptomyces sp. AC602_WCS936]
MSFSSLHIPYALPAVLLLLALSLKTPTFVRAWKDPDVRATSLLLLLASAVFLSVAPASIHKINTVTGVPNIAAPWVYSLLTAFCGSCLTMVITWRDEPSPRRRARIRRIWLIYTGIIVALWATYLLADVPAERIYDLDTYYATEPWMREHILLYLAAHMVSALVAAYMIWKWISKVTDAWLKAGLVFLQAGYAFGLVFDVAKLAAVGARWAGVNWDWLSTRLAPPFAILDASLVGIGFILPQGGPFLQKWIRDQRTYRRLRPLARAIRKVAPSAARARVGRFAPLDLRLLQRQQRIHDGLLRLAPHVDAELLRCAFDEARAAGHRDERARGIAGAIAVRAALEAFLTPTADADDDRAASSARIDSDLDDIEAIASAFRQPRTVDAIRQRVVTTESVNAHA